MLINKNGEQYEISSTDKVAFWGASSRNKDVIDTLGIRNQVIAYIDVDEKKWGLSLDDISINSPDYLKNNRDIIVITVLYKNIEGVISNAALEGSQLFVYVEGPSVPYKELIERSYDSFRNIDKIKYVHFFTDDKFVLPFYSMINDSFNIDEHLFIIKFFNKNTSYGCYEYEKYKKNVIFYDPLRCLYRFWGYEDIYESTVWNNILMNAEKILFHSGWSVIDMERFVLPNLSKIVWIVWGGDAYFNPNMKVYDVLKKIPTVYCSSDAKNQILNNYCIDAHISNATYAYIKSHKSEITQHNKKNEIKILVGHSGDPCGNQIYGMFKLKRFGDNNIKVYAPLTYGNKDYINIVVNAGKKLFGEKFIPITEHIELDEYYDFLNTIDVALFPFVLRKGATTISYLNMIKTPVFINETFLNIYKGIANVKSIEEIDSLTIKDIYNMRSTEIDYDIHKHNQKIINEWKQIM